jgi:hypothetical protein
MEELIPWMRRRFSGEPIGIIKDRGNIQHVMVVQYGVDGFARHPDFFFRIGECRIILV